jgi:pimeloyl-ACP methyl ester carboxylesterase
VPAALVLASAYAGWAGSLSPEETAARLDGVLAAADLPLEEALEGVPGVLSPGAPPGLFEELKVMWADNSGLRKPGGYRAMAHAMAEADLRDVLPQIEVPVLLLYGELDERSPLKVARELHDQIPGSRLVVINGVGHSVNVEAPEEFNAQVRTFLRSVIGSP